MRKKVRVFTALLSACFLASCGGKASTPPPFLAASSTPSPLPGPTSDFRLPTVTAPEPSYKVAAFYYPWYGSPKYDSGWAHWTQNGHQPPLDIASDYFPALGPYSSNDPGVVAQHMAWLRQAGVGVIIVSWWGRGSREEQPLPLILDAAEKYGIKVAFHIEPYASRSAVSLVEDVKYLYERYGSSPAFFRSDAASTYSPSSRSKGVFFIWCTDSAGSCGEQKVDPSYWRPALDAIHALPEGALVIANTTDANAIAGGHFDGLYNYATLHLAQQGGFAWARALPPGALYVPSVLPGMSARRVGYPNNTDVPRSDGQTYNDQWTAALGTGVSPFMVTITSFNEWHEGTNIEPSASGKTDGRGYTYADFAGLPPDGYLALTRQWVEKFEATVIPSSIHARIRLKTTSDWTTLNVVSGGYWLQPQLISASETATSAGFESGDRLVLAQTLDDATQGRAVETVWDIQLAALVPGGTLSLQIDRGNLGSTEVMLYNFVGSGPVEIGAFTWSGLTSGRNSQVVSLSTDRLLNAAP